MISDIEILFKKYAPNIRLQIVSTRGFVEGVDSNMVVLVEVTIGLLPLIWKIFKVWLARHTGGKIKISFKSKDGKVYEAEYSNLTRTEVEKFVKEKNTLVLPNRDNEEFENQKDNLHIPMRIEFYSDID